MQIKPNHIFVVGHSVSNLISCFLLKHNSVELNIHYHHNGTRPKIFWFLFYKFTNYVVNSITFPSKFTLEEAISIVPFIKKKAFINYNPIDLQTSKNKFPPEDKIIIGAAGWLIKRKRFDLFIDLATLLLQESNKFKFLIAGDGPEISFLKSRTELYGISNHFNWLGVISDMDNFYSKINLFVFFTDADSAALTPFEAMSYDVPVVASCKYYGFYDLLKNSKAIYIQNNHNLDEIAKEIRMLISNNHTYQKRIAAARELISNNFSREKHLYDLFKRIKPNI